MQAVGIIKHGICTSRRTRFLGSTISVDCLPHGVCTLAFACHHLVVLSAACRHVRVTL